MALQDNGNFNKGCREYKKYEEHQTKLDILENWIHLKILENINKPTYQEKVARSQICPSLTLVNTML